jgi:Flp pilus assembly CpaE family ATPase
MKENEDEIIDIVRMGDLDKRRGTGMIVLNAQLFTKLKEILEGPELLLKVSKKNKEACVKDLKYE